MHFQGLVSADVAMATPQYNVNIIPEITTRCIDEMHTISNNPSSKGLEMQNWNV